MFNLSMPKIIFLSIYVLCAVLVLLDARRQKSLGKIGPDDTQPDAWFLCSLFLGFIFIPIYICKRLNIGPRCDSSQFECNEKNTVKENILLTNSSDQKKDGTKPSNRHAA